MISHRRTPISMITVLFTLLLILLASLILGQVLGSFYLSGINGEEIPQEERPLNSSGEGVVRKRVLRLKQFPYYTIDLGNYEDKEQALIVGKTFGEKGFPVVISGHPPFKVALGFVNNEEKLRPLAESILVNGQSPSVVKGTINDLSYKFEASDTRAAEEIAPFLGDLSLSLEKALILYTSFHVSKEREGELKSKYQELAQEIEKLAGKALQIAKEDIGEHNVRQLLIISERCRHWARSLQQVAGEWQEKNNWLSQQQALAFLEDYQQFLRQNN